MILKEQNILLIQLEMYLNLFNIIFLKCKINENIEEFEHSKDYKIFNED